MRVISLERENKSSFKTLQTFCVCFDACSLCFSQDAMDFIPLCPPLPLFPSLPLFLTSSIYLTPLHLSYLLSLSTYPRNLFTLFPSLSSYLLPSLPFLSLSSSVLLSLPPHSLSLVSISPRLLRSLSYPLLLSIFRERGGGALSLSLSLPYSHTLFSSLHSFLHRSSFLL